MGMTRRGEMVLPGLEPGEKESDTAWRDFLYGLIRRGLREPVVVITDGSSALIRAVQDCFPRSFRQRCIAHKTRNVLTKVPDHAHDDIKQQLNAISYATSFEEGRHRAKIFIEKYERIYPGAVRSFAEDLTAFLTHLRCPAWHRSILRTTNRIERVFIEQKRRTKVSGVLLRKNRHQTGLHEGIVKGKGFSGDVGLCSTLCVESVSFFIVCQVEFLLNPKAFFNKGAVSLA